MSDDQKALNEKIESLKVDVVCWRVVSAAMAFGYIAIWANTYIFGGAA